MSQTSVLIARGERRAQQIRPARLRYANKDMPCTPGNFDFFERLMQGGGGFQGVNAQPVRILRSDIPTITNAAGQDVPIEFKRGQNVQVFDDESGDVFTLTIGQNNSKQAALIILNLESIAA